MINVMVDNARTLIALLGTAKCNIQVDFGFGDVVIPNPIEEHLPTLIEGVPPPVLQTYPKEAVIAEKFEAMIQLGSRNTRMKDFYDVWALSEIFPFDGALLRGGRSALFRASQYPLDRYYAGRSLHQRSIPTRDDKNFGVPMAEEEKC